MNKDILLTIDNGTQSIRALLFDLNGTLLEKAQVPINPYFSIRPGWAEQKPDYYWEKLCEACKVLWNKTAIPKEAIAGVSITSQRSTVVNLDKSGKPLRPAIVWLDQRRTEGLTSIGGLWGWAFRLSGMTETVAYLQAEAEANWIRTFQPEIWEKTRKYIFLSGYLNFRLTSRLVDSVANQVGYIPFDYKRLNWSKPWDWKWKVAPIEPEMLPKLVPVCSQLGVITKNASNETGIPEHLPVIASAGDKACEVIGAGCLEPHQGCLSYGTTATINTTHQNYIEVIPLIPPFPSAVPGAYNLEIQVYRGYWMVKWFKEEFAFQEKIKAQDQGVTPEVLFDELVRESKPGSMGLVLQPYWSPGLKIPGPEAKGAIIGFGDIHNRASLYRAILEGLAYALREGKERTERKSKIPITDIMVAGGGSQSDCAMQITADIFNLPAARPHTFETSGLGAAIDLAVGLGLHSDFNIAVKEMTRIGQLFEPDSKTRDIYDGLYNRVYKRMYKRLKPLYESIRDITGYPAR